MLDFLLDNMFVIDMLLITFVSFIRFPRRKLFIVRMIGGIVVCILVSNYVSVLLDFIPVMSIVKSVLLFLINFMFIMGVGVFCFKVNFLKVLFIDTTCYLVQHMAFAFDRVVRGEMQPTLAVFFTHFIPLIVIYGLVWVLFIRHIDNDNLANLKWVDVTVITLLLVFICIFLSTFAEVRQEDGLSYRLADVCCNMVGVFCQYGIFSASVLRNNREKTEQLLALKAEQYKISKETIDSLNIKCHDLKHLIHECNTNESIDGKTCDEINKIIDDYESAVETGCPALDIIVTEKAAQCKSLGIRLTCVADGSALAAMQPNDIYALFGNALDNAIESVQKCEEDKRSIGLTVRTAGCMCVINIQNYTPETVEFKFGLPVTTKADKVNHGFGARSIKLIASRYGGEITFTQNEDIFSVNIAIPLKKTSPVSAA